MTGPTPGILAEDPRGSLSLWDYRRRVSELYTAVRALPPEEGWAAWRAGRDRLFAEHPQSPVPPDRRDHFGGLPYFPYDPELRVLARVEAAPPLRTGLPHSGEGTTPARSFGVARFAIDREPVELALYRLEEYGDGVFLPFGDATNGAETYGGGRYLIDTAKGADLGSDGDLVVLDFNFAYHPSCVHDYRWSCPLSPGENRLTVAIRGGERL